MHLTPIHVSPHAHEQYVERAERPISIGRLASIIRNHLLPQLAQGLEPDSEGAVHVRLPGDLKAVASASLQGGWDIHTVLCGDMRPKVEVE